MLIKPLQTKDEIIKEVRSQLSRFMMSETHSIKWLENESRLETEYPITELVAQAGYNSTEEFLYEELYGYVAFAGPGLIKAGRQLYDNPGLQHIVSLQARTEPKDRSGRGGGNYSGRGGGRAGASRYYPQTSNHPPYHPQRYQPSPNYSTQTNFQQERRCSPSFAPPPAPPQEELRRLSPRILFENDNHPSSASPSNFAGPSTTMKFPSSTLIIGPPPGFEEYSQRQIVVNSNEAYEDILASPGSSIRHINNDDPFNVKTAKKINDTPSNDSSPTNRIPPDPKDARFEEAVYGNTLTLRQHGYSTPTRIEVETPVPNGSDISDDDDEEEFFDALEEQPIKLPPCLSFEASEKREYEPPIQHPNVDTTIPIFNNEFPLENYEKIEEDNYLNYFVNVITAIHYNIPSKSEALYYEVIKTLPEKVSPYPGFDAASLYLVIKALGPSFVHGTEKYNAKDGITYIYIKNANRGMKKDEYRMILRSALSFLMPKLSIPIIVNGIKLTKAVVYESRNENYSYFVKVSSTKAQENKLMEMLKNVKTIDLVNPYPRALCICYHNNVPYRAQIIAQITSTKINVELVDVGEFLTVTTDQLKISESDELSKVPRFAIPCKIVNDKKPNLRISLDGFERRSTSKSIPMYLMQKNNKNYVSIKLF